MLPALAFQTLRDVDDFVIGGILFNRACPIQEMQKLRFPSCDQIVGQHLLEIKCINWRPIQIGSTKGCHVPSFPLVLLAILHAPSIMCNRLGEAKIEFRFTQLNSHCTTHCTCPPALHVGLKSECFEINSLETCKPCNRDRDPNPVSERLHLISAPTNFRSTPHTAITPLTITRAAGWDH